MRRALVAFALVLGVTTVAAACHRKVDTNAAPAAPAGPTYTLTVTNNLTKAINVYVTAGGVDTFLRQVAASANEQLPVKGIPAGAAVTLKATTVDGASTYTKGNVNLSSNYTWVVP